jgi:hypothetical protein
MSPRFCPNNCSFWFAVSTVNAPLPNIENPAPVAPRRVGKTPTVSIKEEKISIASVAPLTIPLRKLVSKTVVENA